jgi:hypothetical protein
VETGLRLHYKVFLHLAINWITATDGNVGFDFRHTQWLPRALFRCKFDHNITLNTSLLHVSSAENAWSNIAISRSSDIGITLLQYVSMRFLPRCQQSYKTAPGFPCCLSVCRIYQLENRWTNFCEIRCLGVLLKFVDTFQFWLKSGKNDAHFTWIPTRISARWGYLWGSPVRDPTHAKVTDPRELRRQGRKVRHSMIEQSLP